VYRIRTESGAEVHLDRSQVRQVRHASDAELEYEQIRHSYPNTAEGHERLAEWCGQRRMSAQRKFHLECVVQIDPDHVAARRALGFRFVDGKWITRDEEMAAKGMVRYRGQYRTAQEIELVEREKSQKQNEREWYKKLKRWRVWLDSDKPARVAEARDALRAIQDPDAAPALAEQLQQEVDDDVKLLWIETLAQIASDQALKTLVDLSLSEPDSETRLASLDHLVALDRPQTAGLYIKALKSKSNAELNRAAAALKALGKPEAIPALVDVLVTTEKVRVGSDQPGQTSAGFSPTGGGAFSFGGGAKTVRVSRTNPEVLQALIALSGVNFEYDVKAWNAWYARQQKSPAIDARRD
jgi:hypothetical protein